MRKTQISLIYAWLLLLGAGRTISCDTSLTTVAHDELARKAIIDKVMRYEISHDILKRYQSETNVPWERIPKLVNEAKRFLIMGALNTGQRASMLSEEVDELWHTFILFTQDYDKFCKETLGKFVHHIPCSKDEIAARPPDHYEKAYNHFSSVYKSFFGITPPDDVWMTPDKCNCSDGGGGSRCGAC